MDKGEFLVEAPKYYALAIAHYLRGSSGYVTATSVIGEFSFEVDEIPDTRFNYLEKEHLLKRALDWLVEEGLISVISDPFAPAIYAQAESFTFIWSDLEKRADLPFGRFSVAPDKDAWLRDALSNINSMYLDLGVTDADFAQPDAEWEPLPLDRSEPSLDVAIKSVDATIEEVRKDNGYAAELPEEREFVLDNLKALSTKLREAKTISVAFIRTHGLDVLKKLSRRFKDGTIDIVATAARSALIDWLKTKGIKLLESLWS